MGHLYHLWSQQFNHFIFIFSTSCSQTCNLFGNEIMIHVFNNFWFNYHTVVEEKMIWNFNVAISSKPIFTKITSAFLMVVLLMNYQPSLVNYELKFWWCSGNENLFSSWCFHKCSGPHRFVTIDSSCRCFYSTFTLPPTISKQKIVVAGIKVFMILHTPGIDDLESDDIKRMGWN